MKKQILFSCVGTTDPARGMYDGGVLHILRHYRPEAVCLFLTPEMTAFEEKDHRFEKMFAFVREQWEGYAPEVEMVHARIEDASNLDELDEPMRNAMYDFAAKYPEAQLVLNLSSGTPQMKMLLAQMNLDLRYDTVGVQVKNPERKAGTAQRSNAADYSVDDELAYAQMSETEPGAENRCSEPKLFAVQKEMQWQQVQALIRQRNYTAVAAMGNVLSPASMKLVRHLKERNDLQESKAKDLAKNLKLPFQLYPVKQSASRDYKEVSEYYLMLKNLLHIGKFTEFTLRLNPMVIRLQKKALDRYLRKEYGITTADIMDNEPWRKRKLIRVSKLEQYAPALLAKVDQALYNKGMNCLYDSDPSMFLFNIMLSCLNNVSPQLTNLFDACLKLNLDRNDAAHSLYGMTEADLRDAAGMSHKTLTQELERAMAELYPECDPALFRLYEKCEEHLLKVR